MTAGSAASRFTCVVAASLIASPPELPNTVEDIPNKERREIGSVDPASGRSTVDRLA
jgi:hypothetical protein